MRRDIFWDYSLQHCKLEQNQNNFNIVSQYFNFNFLYAKNTLGTSLLYLNFSPLVLKVKLVQMR